MLMKVNLPWRHRAGKSQSVHAEIAGKLKEFEESMPPNDTPEALNSFTKLVRSYFSKRFHIQYNFTYEELGRETDRKRIDPEIRDRIIALLDDLNQVEYSQSDKTKTVHAFFREFRRIVEQLTPEKHRRHLESHSPGEHFLLWAGSFAKDIKKLAYGQKSGIRLVNRLMKQMRQAVEYQDLWAARESYKAIQRAFESLPDEYREQYYHEIMPDYRQIVRMSQERFGHL